MTSVKMQERFKCLNNHSKNKKAKENPIIYLLYNLHPHSMLYPQFTVTAQCDYFNYLAVFNLPLKEHKNPKFFCLLHLIYEIYETRKLGCAKLAENLIKDDYNISLNVFSALPHYANISQIFISEANRVDVIKRYQGISTWLEYWHSKINTRELKNSNSYNWLEKEALLTARRYELIYELCNRGYLNFNHNLIWLLVEISILRKMILCTANSKEELYRNNKNHIDVMNNFEEKPPQFAVKTEDLLYHSDSYVETLAYNVALQNPDFDKNYYRPYLAAYKSANSSRKKNSNLSNPVNTGLSTPPSKKRRGGKIGHNKKKKH